MKRFIPSLDTEKHPSIITPEMPGGDSMNFPPPANTSCSPAENRFGKLFLTKTIITVLMLEIALVQPRIAQLPACRLPAFRPPTLLTHSQSLKQLPVSRSSSPRQSNMKLIGILACFGRWRLLSAKVRSVNRVCIHLNRIVHSHLNRLSLNRSTYT